MKILILAFYFKPDLCACSFRNSPLVDELSKKVGTDGEIVVLTTMPNRYISYKKEAKSFEQIGNVSIHRIKINEHKSGFLDQIFSYLSYFFTVLKLVKDYRNIDVVYASSSRLFTAFLGACISKRLKVPLYLDIRDIFKEAIGDVIGNVIIRSVLTPLLSIIENFTFRQAAHINLVSGGFKNYFKRYSQAGFSFFTNGIDDVFLEAVKNNSKTVIEIPHESEDGHRKKPHIITYAGNIGDSQGLDIIIPELAKELGSDYKFILIGDGGAKLKLIDALENENVENVELINPMDRDKLLEYYFSTDFFFLHLNALPAFEKVIPSKLFEYAVFNVPIIAGVTGFCAEFIRDNISDCFIFKPGDHLIAGKLIKDYRFGNIDRSKFISEYSRNNINSKMAASIVHLGNPVNAL